MGKHHADTQHKDEGVPSLRAEHSSAWQRNIDSILTPRGKTECLPHAQSQATSIRNSISYRRAIAWNSLTNKEATAKTLKDFKRCLRKFDADNINFEPILAITNNRDTDYKYF